MKIYNLEFSHFNGLRLGGYIFRKIKNYDEAFRGLAQHVSLGGPLGAEIKPQTGTHQITAMVEIPIYEKHAILPWENKEETALADILLLLTIFTDRDVFLKNWEGDPPIIADPRLHQWGDQLRLSASFEVAWQNIETGDIITEKPENVWEFEYIDIGFEKSINTVLNTILSKEWQEQYDGGYFLFLYRDMIRRQILEKSFLTCWTIWEQIFALHNQQWLTDEDIYRLGGDKKIAFILDHYFKTAIDNKGKKNLCRLTKSRNRLVHFGKKMENVDNKEKEMFIRLTEQLIALILGLKPSNVLNSFEKLNEFLKK